MAQHFVNDDGAYPSGVDSYYIEQEKIEQSYQRYSRYVKNENAKRRKIRDLAGVLEMDNVILVLDMFLPSVTARTIMAGINNQMLPEPNKFDR